MIKSPLFSFCRVYFLLIFNQGLQIKVNSESLQIRSGEEFKITTNHFRIIIPTPKHKREIELGTPQPRLTITQDGGSNLYWTYKWYETNENMFIINKVKSWVN